MTVLPISVDYDPEILTSTQFMNEVVTKTLLVSNTGDVTLTFNFTSSDMPSNIFWMRLDEPSNATVYQGDSLPGGFPPWLTMDPISGSIPANNSTEIRVAFDSCNLQPDTYVSRISLQSDDPISPTVSIPVTMTVLPGEDIGRVVGKVYDSWTSKPMVASVDLVGIHSTIADPSFEFWAKAGSYSLTGSASGYWLVTKTVLITAGGIVTQNLALSPLERYLYLPCIVNNYCESWFFDDFSNPNSGWEVVDDEFVRTEYLDREFRILTKQAGYIYLFPAPTCSREDYEVEVVARWVGSYVNAYGIVFGLTEGFENFYLFQVDAELQLYWLIRSSPSGFTFIKDYQYSTAINPGTAPNHLYVKRDGNKITLKVNGTTLGTWTDGNINGMTWVGVSASQFSGLPAADARFDNFSVYRLGGSLVSGSRWLGAGLENVPHLGYYEKMFMVPLKE